jgi:hypothetical protein
MGWNDTKGMEKLLEEANRGLGSDLRRASEFGGKTDSFGWVLEEGDQIVRRSFRRREGGRSMDLWRIER